MSSKTHQISDRLHEYLVGLLGEHPILRQLRAETARLPMAGMQISPEQGGFMAWLVRVLKARRCIEVGVFTGYSSICVARELPADGLLVACDTSPDYTAVARRYWRLAGVEALIDLRLQPALVTLDELLKGGAGNSFDFAFIDADKQNYDAYFERCLMLLRPGGVIAIDNAVWDGKVADPQANDPSTSAIRSLNQKIAEDARVGSSLVPIGDGLMLVHKHPA